MLINHPNISAVDFVFLLGMFDVFLHTAYEKERKACHLWNTALISLLACHPRINLSTSLKSNLVNQSCVIHGCPSSVVIQADIRSMAELFYLSRLSAITQPPTDHCRRIRATVREEKYMRFKKKRWKLTRTNSRYYQRDNVVILRGEKT